jgi:hypothetical protein
MVEPPMPTATQPEGDLHGFFVPHISFSVNFSLAIEYSP